jgi:hypothetical protein
MGFWVVTLGSVVAGYQSFRSPYCLLLENLAAQYKIDIKFIHATVTGPL